MSKSAYNLGYEAAKQAASMKSNPFIKPNWKVDEDEEIFCDWHAWNNGYENFFDVEEMADLINEIDSQHWNVLISEVIQAC